MARCPECNRFVSLDQESCPEMSSELVDEQLQVNVRGQLNCAECGSELLTVDMETDISLEHQHGLHGCEPIEVDDEEVEPVDRFEGKGRYAKHFYGYDYTAVVKYSCGHEEKVSAVMEEQASNFEEAY